MRTPYSSCIDGLDCYAVAVMDDFYLYGPQAFTAFDRFSASLPPLNLSLNLPKCNALLPVNPDPDTINDCTSRHLPYSSISIPSLGSIISRNPNTVSDWLVDQVTSLHVPFFNALLDTHPLNMPSRSYVLVWSHV